MKELSLNILDIAKNSVRAGADLINISLYENENGWLDLIIKDNGCGMSEEMLKRISDPFCTTRQTRNIGMGIPLLKMAAEQTGGAVDITSTTDPQNSGTVVKATFDTKSIDFMPIGDIVSTICVLIAGSPEIDFDFYHKMQGCEVSLKTAELRVVLGGEISLAEPEIQQWIKEYLTEQYLNTPYSEYYTS